MTRTRDAATAGQVSATAAEIYDSFFVPALFGEWAEPLCGAAGLKPGDTVLDVACGTGATSRTARHRVSPIGMVTGLDCNKGMLAIARSRSNNIAFVTGMAETLPFPDREFDAVLCQFGLMFFDDRACALREMNRVLKPTGKAAVSVWDKVEQSPGYARMISLIHRLFGAEAADALRAPFNLGELSDLQRTLDTAGISDAKIVSRTGTARFSSIAEWVRLDVRGWTLSDMIDDNQFALLVTEAERDLAEFAGADGTVSFPAPAHIVTWSAVN